MTNIRYVHNCAPAGLGTYEFNQKQDYFLCTHPKAQELIGGGGFHPTAISHVWFEVQTRDRPPVQLSAAQILAHVMASFHHSKRLTLTLG